MPLNQPLAEKLPALNSFKYFQAFVLQEEYHVYRLLEATKNSFSFCILVLDEATSSLDTENEEKIQQAIERLKGTMTIIVIAHRLSTIRNADQVIVLEEGEVIQSGAFGQLAKEKTSVFSNLLKNQMQATK